MDKRGEKGGDYETRSELAFHLLSSINPEKTREEGGEAWRKESEKRKKNVKTAEQNESRRGKRGIRKN